MDDRDENGGSGGDGKAAIRYGPYEILKPIGKGKFAVVYRAKRVSDDGKDETVVALKRISVDSIDEKARDKCLKEVGLLQSLDHPNIIRYLDKFITENDLVIVFEWAAAGDLKRQLRKAQERGVGFEERVIWKYFSQICDAIAHMHERRIMHRDLKPANIFLTLDGTVKVGDLGLSRELSEHTVQAHSKVGTPLYMSPEVLRGDGYDFKSDIWSLGCLLYELAMLKSPFKSEGLNLYSLFQKISQGDFQPLPENYSEELRSLAYAMISTRSEDRPEIAHVCNTARKMRALYSSDKSSNKRATPATATGPASAASSGGAVNGGASVPLTMESNYQQVGKVAEEEKNSRKYSVGVDEEEDGQRNQREEKALPAGRFSASSSPMAAAVTGTTAAEAEAKQTNSYPSFGRGGVEGAVAGARSSNNNNSGSYENDEKKGYSLTTAAEGAAAGDASSHYRDVNRNQGGSSSSAIWGDGGGGRGKGRGEGGDPASPRYEYTPSSSTSNAEALAKTKAAAPAVTRRIKQQQPVVAPNNANAAASSSSSGGVGRGRAGGGAAGAADEQEDYYDPRRDATLTSADSADRDSAATPLQGSSVAFALMDTLYHKLLVLGYPMEDPDGADAYTASFGGERGGGGAKSGRVGGRAMPNGRGRLLPLHFACEMSLVGRVAGHERDSQFFQFRRMVHVAMWLCQKIGGTGAQAVAKMDLERDSPVMVAKQLLGAAQSAGVSSQVLSEVLPTALSLGHGEKVCLFLCSLVDVCIVSAQLTPLVLNYLGSAAGNDEDFALEGGEDTKKQRGGRKNVDKDDDEVMEESGEGDMHNGGGDDRFDGGGGGAHSSKGGGFTDLMNTSAHDLSGSAGAHYILGNSFVHATIDPALWREEAERVSAQLARANNERMLLGGSGWSDHLMTMQRFAKEWYGAEGAGGGEGGNSSSKNDKGSGLRSCAEISQTLVGLGKEMQTELASLGRGENLLNAKEHISRLGVEFGESKRSANELQERTGTSSKRIEEMAEKLAGVEEKLDEVLEKVDAKTGGSAEGDVGGGGNSSAVRYREAIKSIKEEITAMALNIGLLESTILLKRLAKAKEARLHDRKKRNAKHRLGNNKHVVEEGEF